MRNRTSIYGSLDWVTIFTYLVLVIIGWLSIYAAVYNEEHSEIFDLSQRYGNQLIWIVFSIIVAVVILMIEGSFFTSFAYPIYGSVLLLLIGVLLFGAEIKGAKSWFRIGSFAFQPAEFGKFATGLALAKYLSTLGINMKDFKTKLTAIAIIGIPALFILLQNDTGSMLVYFSFVIVLYREGLSGNVLLMGIATAFLFIISLLMRLQTFTFFDKEIGGETLLVFIIAAI